MLTRNLRKVRLTMIDSLHFNFSKEKMFFKITCTDIDEYEKPFRIIKYFECFSFADIDQLLMRYQLNIIKVDRIQIDTLKPK